MTVQCFCDIMQEIYKDILGYEGLYQVSNLGNIKSLARAWNYGANGNARTKPETIMKPALSEGGYLHVPLSKDGKTKSYRVHFLVWDAFGDMSRAGLMLQVDHINGIKTDNRFENLQLLTPRENVIKHHKDKDNFCYGTHKVGNKYAVQATINGKLRYLGIYETRMQAENVYKKVVGL